MHDIDSIYEWLVAGAPGARTAKEVVARICPELAAAGIPIVRIEAFVRTLHPQIVGRSFIWRPGAEVEVRENSWSYLNSPAFMQSPAAKVFSTGKPVRRNLMAAESLAEFPQLQELAREGMTDFFAGPLTFLSGQTQAITFATRADGGFTAAHLAAIERVLIPLSRVGEILALHRTAANLLSTYVGRGAGERILAGQIMRGDTQSIRAVIWFSDIRGFSSMSERLPPTEIIGVLNEIFDCQVPAIESHGGEVLKFMGDGLLAIFPFSEGETAPGRLCDQALLAARDAFAQLAVLNAARQTRGLKPVTFGLALHVGELAYGNIGGSGRLDFTCIGKAVNLASRLEGLTSKLGRSVVLSEDFAAATNSAVTPLGNFELKGLDGMIAVFAPLVELA
ncbi:MAG: adenylate/guanylate cyclase domain-containing protein [Planctomycetes bacterium]|nr:adenylate/guanylate cyclase domain-containing protein [Planctomycetota bacterium]